MSATSDNLKLEAPEVALKAADDPKPEVAEAFFYPVNGTYTLCRRLSENSKGVSVQIIGEGSIGLRPQFIAKEHYGLIKPLDFMPETIPPCDRPAPKQMPAIIAITAATPEA